MIYTLTFNPSLDYIIQVENFTFGTINKTHYENILPGGKGINVSIVLSNLGYENIALGFIAGFTGKEIEARMNQFGCRSDFIEIPEGLSRINVKMKSNEESEINGMGPIITQDAIEALYTKLDMLDSHDILIISGSIPHSLPNDVYEKIIQRLKHKSIKVIVDATKQLLMNVLSYQPFLIKPNHHELSELFNVTLTTHKEVIYYAKKLQQLGAKNVLVSMAEKGAILIDEYGNIHQSDAPKGKLVNSVGAGDSMVAGFLYGYLTYQDYHKAFLYSICAGSASTFSSHLCTKKEVETLLKNYD